MAKKKTVKPKVPVVPEEAIEPKAKPVRLDLTPQEHRELRAVAGLHGQSMTVFAHDAVVRVVKEELDRRGIEI